MNLSDEHSIFGKTSLWTVASSIAGGITKAHACPLFLNTLSLDGSLTVVAYAFMSGVIGYGTKKGLDYLCAKFKKK